MSSFILELAVKSSLLILAAAALNLLLHRRGSATVRHLIWVVAFVALAFLPTLLVTLPRWDLSVPITATPAPVDKATPASFLPGQGTSAVDVVSGAGVASDETSPAPSRQRNSLSISTLALVVYAIGFCLVSVRLARQRWLVNRVANRSVVLVEAHWLDLLEQCGQRLGVGTKVRLLRSRDEAVPMTFGLRVPTIVIPAVADTWEEDRKQAVILHELAHVARRDCLAQMLAAATCALYWFHPGAWWMARRLRDEREIACDDRVVAAGTSPTDYAQHLLELAYACAGHRAPALAVHMARPNEIEARLRAILDSARNRRAPALFTSLSVGMIAAAALAALATVRATMVPVDAQSAVSPANASTPSQVIAPREQSRVDAGAVDIAAGRSGTWEMWVSENGVAEFRLSDRSGSWRGLRTTIDELQMQGSPSGDGGTWRWNLRTDAGTFALEGVMKRTGPKSGVSAGTFTFVPSETFPSELVKRGFSRPTVVDQYLLARSGIGLAFIDELTAQGYARPDLPLLVRRPITA